MTDTATGPAGPNRRHLIGAGLGALGGAVALSALASSPAEATSAPSARFYSYGPSRVVDSRTSGGKLAAGATRNVSFSGQFATGFDLTVVINVSVTSTESAGFLTLWQAGQSKPSTANINWWGSGQTYGNLAFVGLRSSDVSLSVYAHRGTHFIIDILGYFWLPPGAQAQGQSPAEKKQ